MSKLRWPPERSFDIEFSFEKEDLGMTIQAKDGGREINNSKDEERA